MRSRGAGLAAIIAAVAVLVATRIPSSEPRWTIVSIVLGLGTCALAAVFLWAPTPPALGAGVFVLSLGHLLVPTSREAALSAAPAWAVPLIVVAALHVFFSNTRTNAPVVATARLGASPWAAVRLLPAALAFAGLIALPMAYAWVVPERVRAAYELHTALAPLAPLVFLSAFLLVAGALRQSLSAIWARDAEEPDGAATPAPSLGVEPS